MALPIDQVIRKQQFVAANPAWSIVCHDRGNSFTAERNDPIHVVGARSLRELLDRLETIVEREQPGD